MKEGCTKCRCIPAAASRTTERQDNGNNSNTGRIRITDILKGYGEKYHRYVENNYVVSIKSLVFYIR